MLFRNFLLGVPCVLVQAALFSGLGVSADRSELHRRNQELVAKDYEPKDGQLIAARIGQRKPQVECSGLSRFLGACREPSEIEIVGYLKSGEQLAIHRVLTLGLVGVWPTIVDRAGDTVGYFHSNLELEATWPSHRVDFVIYFVSQKGLIRREGQAKCYKLPKDGIPSVQTSNARFDSELRELEFTLRSSCYHVELFGSGPVRSLNMLSGDFLYNADLKDHRLVDLSQRVTVSFDAGGDSFTLAVAKGYVENRRAFKKCVENAKTAAGFHVCSDGPTRGRAFWRFGADQVSVDSSCELGSEVAGETYFVRACPSTNSSYDATNRLIDFTIASHDAPRGMEANIECSCIRLWVDRLSFNPQLRTLAFNLDTDAKVIKFAGGEFHIPTMASRAIDGRMTMEIPVFTIRFNEHWQIVEMSAVVGGTPAASGP